jgi:hypothetical protein
MCRPVIGLLAKLIKKFIVAASKKKKRQLLCGFPKVTNGRAKPTPSIYPNACDSA